MSISPLNNAELLTLEICKKLSRAGDSTYKIEEIEARNRLQNGLSGQRKQSSEAMEAMWAGFLAIMEWGKQDGERNILKFSWFLLLST